MQSFYLTLFSNDSWSCSLMSKRIVKNQNLHVSSQGNYSKERKELYLKLLNRFMYVVVLTTTCIFKYSYASYIQNACIEKYKRWRWKRKRIKSLCLKAIEEALEKKLCRGIVGERMNKQRQMWISLILMFLCSSLLAVLAHKNKNKKLNFYMRRKIEKSCKCNIIVKE